MIPWVTMNELTTIASVVTHAQFMDGPTMRFRRSRCASWREA
jgi:hypothetical protein